jgi:hypothetical protein
MQKKVHEGNHLRLINNYVPEKQKIKKTGDRRKNKCLECGKVSNFNRCNCL